LCRRGRQWCGSSARWWHGWHGGVRGQVSDIEIQAKEILRLRTQLNDILAKHTGKTADQIARDTDRDYFLTALEAKAYGIVDEILIKQVQEEK